MVNDGTLYRAFAPDLEVMTRAQGGDGRTVRGIAVPYRQPMRIDESLTEQFARGAFNHQLRAAHRIPFARDHIQLGGQLLGRLVDMRDEAGGLFIAARVSQTAAGDDTLELIRDGALSHLSIGFREYPAGNKRLSGGVVERTKADLREVATVLEGAYGEHAVIAEVRQHSQDRRKRAAQILAGLPQLD